MDDAALGATLKAAALEEDVDRVLDIVTTPGFSTPLAPPGLRGFLLHFAIEQDAGPVLKALLQEAVPPGATSAQALASVVDDIRNLGCTDGVGMHCLAGAPRAGVRAAAASLLPPRVAANLGLGPGDPDFHALINEGGPAEMDAVAALASPEVVVDLTEMAIALENPAAVDIFWRHVHEPRRMAHVIMQCVTTPNPAMLVHLLSHEGVLIDWRHIRLPDKAPRGKKNALEAEVFRIMTDLKRHDAQAAQWRATVAAAGPAGAAEAAVAGAGGRERGGGGGGEGAAGPHPSSKKRPRGG
jgi:hypothetical protein